MNKLLGKWFIANLVIITAVLVVLGVALKAHLSDYTSLILAGLTITAASQFVAYKLFLRPVKEMQEVIARVSKGDFGSRLDLTRRDELGALANDLNDVSTELQNRISEAIQDKNELKAILSSMVEGVILVDKNEKILLLNDPVYQMLELRSRETIGKSYWEIIRNEEINALLRDAFKFQHSFRKEITIIAPQEAHFLMQASPVHLESGSLSAVVAVFHDITELKKLAKMRSEFVANVSHELKTPLTSIKGFVETLREGAMNDKERAQKFLDIIQRHTERLENLVDDILSLSAIETKELQLSLKQASIVPLLETVANLYKERLESRQLHLNTQIAPGLPAVLIDQLKMEQVFVNLLDNAVKFSAPGGLITIRAIADNGYLRVDVQDAGIGIEQQHLPRIFERFYRVDKGRSRDQGGTGLGLSIVKHIVQRHHGKVSVQSEPGKGSVFSVILPSVLPDAGI